MKAFFKTARLVHRRIMPKYLSHVLSKQKMYLESVHSLDTLIIGGLK
jgi:hypothetical protein